MSRFSSNHVPVSALRTISSSQLMMQDVSTQLVTRVTRFGRRHTATNYNDIECCNKAGRPGSTIAATLSAHCCNANALHEKQNKFK
eukprot:6462373-Amphidinium_carterae.2